MEALVDYPTSSGEQYPAAVSVFEVGPRDGLQNEPDFIPTAKKIELVDRLTGAGCVDACP